MINVIKQFDGNKRLIVKGITWELFGLLILFLMSNNFEFSLLYILLRIFTYPIFHKLWKNIKWGK